VAIENKIHAKLCVGPVVSAERYFPRACPMMGTESEQRAFSYTFLEWYKVEGFLAVFSAPYFSYFCIFRAKESGQKNKKLKNQNDIILLGEKLESTLAGVKNPCYLFVYSNIFVSSFFRGGRIRVPVIVNC
jgi:hypothetical protein